MSEAEKQEAQEQKAQQLQAQYNNYQEALTELQSQLSTITSQVLEHNIVDKTLAEIPPEKRNGRKCFKMIGGVLVEKTVDEVIKILDEEKKQLLQTREEVEKSFVSTKKEMEQWMTKNKVKIMRQ